jgi:hypothetical protein
MGPISLINKPPEKIKQIVKKCFVGSCITTTLDMLNGLYQPAEKPTRYK